MRLPDRILANARNDKDEEARFYAAFGKAQPPAVRPATIGIKSNVSTITARAQQACAFER